MYLSGPFAYTMNLSYTSIPVNLDQRVNPEYFRATDILVLPVKPRDRDENILYNMFYVLNLLCITLLLCNTGKTILVLNGA